MKKKQKGQAKDDNIGSEEQKRRDWTKREMEEAEPLPIPEIPDDEEEIKKKSEK